MPVLNITAVDNTNDTLTIPAHGLTTGDGFLGIYSPDGGTPPAPIASTDNLWAIRIDDDHIKVASSSTNAMAGTAINLTTNGSGTLQLLQGLPYRVPAVYAVGTPVKSAHLNATWLALVALWNFLTGQAQAVFNGIKLALNQNIELSGTGTYKHGTHKLIVNGAPLVTVGTVTQGTDGLGGFSPWILAANTTAYIRVDGLRYCGAVNSRITAVRVHHSGPLTGSSNLSVSLSRVVSTTGAKTDEGTTGNTGSPINVAGLSRDTFGLSMFVKLVTTSSDYGIRYIELDYEMGP